MDGRDRQLFNELHCSLVTSPIHVRYWCLTARKIAVLFSFNGGFRSFYAACCFDDLSRGSSLCLLNASFGTAISQCHNSIIYTPKSMTMASAGAIRGE